MRLEAIAAVALMSISASAQHGSSPTLNPYTSPENERAGRTLYRAQCAGCHGPDGSGTGAGPNLASANFKHGSSDEAIFRTISTGLPGTSMPGFTFSNQQIWELVTHVRALAIAGVAGQSKGDARSGMAIFRANCAGCHAVSGEGGLSGPDLTSVAARRSMADLRQSITNPDADVSSQHWSVVAVTNSGQTIKGIRLNEDTFSVQIRDQQDRLVSLQKQDLKSLELIRRSPMPSFTGKLTSAQIDDVIGWLSSLGRRQ